MDRPLTPLSVTSYRSFEASPLGRKATFGHRLAPVTPTRSIGPLNVSKTIDENEQLVIPNSRRGANLPAKLRLSTASLGAVRRPGTPTSTMTASGSFYSALEAEEDDDDGHSQTHDDCSSISETVGYADSLSGRRDSYDTVAYEPSSAPSSPQRARAGDDSYHFSSYLSPPPRAPTTRQSAPTSPQLLPADSPSLVNKPLLPRLSPTTLPRLPLASSNSTLKSPRTRYCTYISIHTGVRCNAPTCQLKTLCPVHLHSTGLTRNRIDQHQYRRLKKDDSISKASLAKNQHWCPGSEANSSLRSSPSQTSPSRTPLPHSPSESLRGDNALRDLAMPSHRADSDGYRTASNSPTLLISPPTNHLPSSPASSDEGFSLSSIMIIPSTSCSASVVGAGDRELCQENPFIKNDAIVSGSTVIDWKTNESRRREYEEADRRRKGLWGWLRTRVRSLCCVRDQSEFWDNGKGDGGSVRRYRLVLPEEREKNDDVKLEQSSFAAVVAAAQAAAGRSDSGELCSAPSTPRSLRNPYTWKSPRLEETVLRRASVAGDLDWRLAMASQTAKDPRLRNIIKEVGSCESPHYTTRNRQSSPLLPQHTPPSPVRAGGKSRRLGEERTSFWKNKKCGRWS